MRKLRFSTSSLLVCVACAAIAIVIGQRGFHYYSPAERYKRSHSIHDLHAAFATQIVPGTSYEAIVQLLGEGQPQPEDFIDGYVRAEENGHYPPGTHQKGDKMIVFHTTSRHGYGLLFRDGILVNFDPSEYESPPVRVSALGL